MTAIAFKLTIPKPCHNDWEEMLPNGNGRFCLDCNKTVIDFTQFTDEAVKAYFTTNQQPTCGRFYKKQLDRITIRIPNYVLQKKLPAWKQFLLLLLICFGGMVLPIDVSAYNKATTYTETTVKKNTVKKKKRNRRHRRKCQVYWPFKDIDWIPTEMGEMANTRAQPKVIIRDGNVFLRTINHADLLIPDTDSSKNIDSPVPEKNPYQPVEAALPALAAVSSKKRRTPPDTKK
jgi:hypothetical protein